MVSFKLGFGEQQIQSQANKKTLNSEEVKQNTDKQVSKDSPKMKQGVDKDTVEIGGVKINKAVAVGAGSTALILGLSFGIPQARRALRENVGFIDDLCTKVENLFKREGAPKNLETTTNLENKSEILGENITPSANLENKSEILGENITPNANLENKSEIAGENISSNANLENKSEILGENITPNANLENKSEILGENITSNTNLENKSEVVVNNLESTEIKPNNEVKSLTLIENTKPNVEVNSQVPLEKIEPPINYETNHQITMDILKDKKTITVGTEKSGKKEFTFNIKQPNTEEILNSIPSNFSSKSSSISTKTILPLDVERPLVEKVDISPKFTEEVKNLSVAPVIEQKDGKAFINNKGKKLQIDLSSKLTKSKSAEQAVEKEVLQKTDSVDDLYKSLYEGTGIENPNEALLENDPPIAINFGKQKIEAELQSNLPIAKEQKIIARQDYPYNEYVVDYDD